MNRTRSIVVIGRHGQLARELAALTWPRDCLPHFLGRGEIDLFSPTLARNQLSALRPLAIINTAAYTAVDAAETEPELAHLLNAELPFHLGNLALHLDIPLLHVSSDYVFDGSAGAPYPESTVPRALSLYGRTKLAGDIALLDSAADVVVVRSAWLFGWQGHNFMKTILARAAASPTLRVVNDQIGSPTPATILAATLRDLALDLVAGKPLPRLLHFAGFPATSWHDFAAAILQAFHDAGHLAGLPQLQAIASCEYPALARRPAMSVLDSGLAARLGYPTPDWRAALAALARNRHPAPISARMVA